MPEPRDCQQYGRHYMLLNLLSMLPFLPVFIIVFIRVWKHHLWDHWTWLGMGWFVLGAILGLWWQHRRHTRMKCPQCGALLIRRARDVGDGDPINFTCEQCDVEWVTGLSHSGSG